MDQTGLLYSELIMTYLATNTFTTYISELSLSADQTVTSTATLIDFDTIRKDAGSSVSLVSGGNGRIRLGGGRSYWIQGCIAIDRTSTADDYTGKWYNTSGTELTESNGACDSVTPRGLVTDSRVCQLLVTPSTDTDYDLKAEGAAGDVKSDGTSLIIMEFA